MPAVVKSNNTLYAGLSFCLNQYSEKLNANKFAGCLMWCVGFSMSSSGVVPLVFTNIFFTESLIFKQANTD